MTDTKIAGSAITAANAGPSYRNTASSMDKQMDTSPDQTINLTKYTDYTKPNGNMKQKETLKSSGKRMLRTKERKKMNRRRKNKRQWRPEKREWRQNRPPRTNVYNKT